MTSQAGPKSMTRAGSWSMGAGSLASASETKTTPGKPIGTGHPDPSESNPTRTFWVVIRRFGSKMNLIGKEEFVHKDFKTACDIMAQYVKKMEHFDNLPFSHFTIEIIASRE